MTKPKRPKPILTPKQQAEKEGLKALKRHEREINRRLNAILPEINKILDKQK